MKLTLKIIGNTLLVFIFLIGLSVAWTMLPIKNNFKIYSVMSGSMAPTIKPGSVVFVKPADSYQINNIITFKNPTDPKVSTTHRLVDVKTVNGSIVGTTKGDANNASDTGKVNAKEIIGKVKFSVPLLGYPFAFVKTIPGLVIVIIIPATIIIYEEVRKIRHEAAELIKKRKLRKLNKTGKPKTKGKKNEKTS